MKSIIRKELKLLLKGKGNLFFLFAMPMLFIVLFGSVFSSVGNSTLTVNYVDLDKTGVSQSFVQSIDKVKGFALKDNSTSSVSDAIQQIKDGKQSSLLVIPKGFGAELSSGATPARLQFYTDPASDSVSGPIESVLNGIANRYQAQRVATALGAVGKSPAQIRSILQSPIHIQSIQETGGSTMTMIDQVVPGYTVMFVFFIILSMIRSFLGEKESGMLSRLLSTPMNPLTYLLGMWIPALIAVLVQCVVLLGFGHFAYGVHLGDLTALSLIVLTLGISGTGIGLALSMLVRGENQGRGITMLITIGGAALGGLWVPIQFMPKIAQTLAKFTPQYWAQQAFQNVMLRGAHVGDVWQAIVVLVVIGLVGLLVALARFQHFLKTASS